MELEEGVLPENVKNKSLTEIYNNSTYLRAVTMGMKDYSNCEGEEHCYGQYLRKSKAAYMVYNNDK